MFKHNIAYIDFNGEERQEDFHFHLSLPEVTRIEAKVGKSLAEHAKALVQGNDSKELIEFMEDIILSSYGKKTADGRSFIKNKDIRSEFEYSQAYAELFEQFITDPVLAQKFGEGVADNGKSKKNRVAPTVVE